MTRATALLMASAISLALNAPATAACNGDLDGDGRVTIGELVSAVNSALTSCDPLPGPRFIDNGNGTVTDNATGLIWEQKVPGADCLHCAEREMDWSTAMDAWLSKVNGFIPDAQHPESQVGFGGYTDWRVPNLAELRSLLDCFPCFNPVLGPDVECIYWTASTLGSSPSGAGAVESTYGTTIGIDKTTHQCVRAVRGLRR